MHIHATLEGVFEGKNGEIGNFCSFIPYEYNNLGLTSNSVKIGSPV